MQGTLSLRSVDTSNESRVSWHVDDPESLQMAAALWEESARAGFVFVDAEKREQLPLVRVRAGFHPTTAPPETVIVAAPLAPGDVIAGMDHSG